MRSIWIPLIVSISVIVFIFLAAENLETIFTQSLEKMVANKTNYSLLSSLLLIGDVFLPVPSSIILFMNGYVLGGFTGFFVSFISLLVGALIAYYLGWFTSKGLNSKAADNAKLVIDKYGYFALIISRGIPILSESICFVCAYNKMPIRKYMLYNFIGYLPICLLYTICGSFGYQKNVFLFAFLTSFLISLLLWFLGKKGFVLKQKAENV